MDEGRAGRPDGGGTPDDEPAAQQLIGRPTGGFRSAVSWSFVLTLGRTLTSVAITFVLARLLGPEAFGLVAMAMVFILFVEMLVQQGLIPAIVQRAELTRSHLDTAFWMLAFSALVAVPIVAAVSGWWAGVNDTPELAAIIIALSAVLPLKALGVVAEAQLQRKLEFRLLAIRTSIAVVTGGVLGIVAAFVGLGVWALVVQHVVTAALELVLIWTMTPWRPSFRYSPRSARELLGFSGPTALASLGAFLERRSDALLIGLFFGPVVVGLYRMATRLIDIALNVASGALQAAFLPELSRFQHDRGAFNTRTVEILRLGAILAMPLLGVLAAVSEPLLTLLGEAWTPAAAALQILCLLAATHALAKFTGPILQAVGRPGLFAQTTWVTAAVGSGAFVIAGLALTDLSIATQVVSIAAIRTVALGSAFFVIVLPAVRIGTGLPIRRALAAIVPSFLAAGAGFLVVTAARELPVVSWPDGPLIDLLASGLLAVSVTATVLYLAEPTARRLLDIARNRAVFKG